MSRWLFHIFCDKSGETGESEYNGERMKPGGGNEGVGKVNKF